MRDPVILPEFSDYRIWDTGVIESKKSGEWKPLKPTPYKPSTYLFVKLMRDDRKCVRFAVQHLVLIAFVGPKKKRQVCRHLNGNPQDNRLENLKWGTHVDNAMDAVRHGTLGRDSARHKNHPSKLSSNQVKNIIEMGESGVPGTILAQKFGVTPSGISNILTGKSWKRTTGDFLSSTPSKPRQLNIQKRLNVMLLSALGFPQRRIASWVGLHRTTVLRYLS